MDGTSTGVVKVLRSGAETKPDPCTILTIANPALEAPWNSGTFVPDPILANEPGFDLCVQYILEVFFGNLPDQREKLLGDPAISPR